jgi:hypothetical protein
MKMGVSIVAVLVAAAVIGCGGGDGGGTSSVTKAEFISRADAICKKTITRREAAVLALLKEQRERGEPTAREVQEQTEEVLLEVALPALSQLTDELAALGRPAGGGNEVDAMIEAYRVAIEEAEAEPAIFVDGEADPFAQPRKLAVAYGAKVCYQV